MRYETSDFARLYAIVTSNLEAFIGTGERDPDFPISVRDAEWLRYLIVVFRQLFNDWQVDSGLSEYLGSLERWPARGRKARRVHRLFRLAGHVYLHVAFDLTRGLAGTLPAPVAATRIDRSDLFVPASSDSFARPEPVIAHSRNDARMLFLRASPAVDQALQSDEGITLLEEVSVWAKALRFFPSKKRRQVLLVMAQWVIALRGSAWIAAETIADTAPPARAEFVARLRQAVIDAQTGVAERFRVTDFEPFGFPILSVAAPLLLVLNWLQTPGTWLAVAVLLVAAWVDIFRRAQRRQEDVMDGVDALGAALVNAMVELVENMSKSDAATRRPPPRPVDAPLLTLRDVSLRFGGVMALVDVSFDVHEHEIFGIVGPNGAGKTSVLDVITGMRVAQQGTVAYKGQQRSAVNPNQAARDGISRTFLDARLFSTMTVYDNILVGRTATRRSTLLQRALRLEPAQREDRQSRQKVHELIDLLELESVRDELAGRLSPALQKRVGLARALAGEPDLLLLDEPMAGLSRDERLVMGRLILEINDRFRTTIVLAEHDARIALDLCDRVVVLDHGLKMAEGTPQELRATSIVETAYRGASSKSG